MDMLNGGVTRSRSLFFSISWRRLLSKSKTGVSSELTNVYTSPYNNDKYMSFNLLNDILILPTESMRASTPSTALLTDNPQACAALDAYSRQKGNLIGKSKFRSFVSPDDKDTYIGCAIGILSPVHVFTISRNEPKSGQASEHCKG